MRFLHLLKIIWQSHRKWGIYWEYLGIYFFLIFLDYLGIFGEPTGTVWYMNLLISIGNMWGNDEKCQPQPQQSKATTSYSPIH
jgi:hypothetical protein